MFDSVSVSDSLIVQLPYPSVQRSRPLRSFANISSRRGGFESCTVCQSRSCGSTFGNCRLPIGNVQVVQFVEITAGDCVVLVDYFRISTLEEMVSGRCLISRVAVGGVSRNGVRESVRGY